MFSDLREAHQAQSRRYWLKMLLIFAVIVVLRLMTYELNSYAAGQQTIPGSPVPGSLGMALLLPLVWVVVWVPLRLFMQGGTIKKKYWNKNPSMQRPKMIDIAQDRIIFWDPYFRQEYQWPAFVSFRETKSLFCLYTSQSVMELIPKRAFAEPAAVDWFRTFLQHNISSAPASFGFAMAAPIPVQPIAPQAIES